jgi:hypothetical protein
MTDPARTNSLGVVDPMRLPIPTALARWWRKLPLLGRAFVGLAAIDTTGRIVGFLYPQIVLYDLADPVLILANLFPRELVILLPVLVLSRRADAAEATPLVVRGAVLLALVEFLRPLLLSSGFGCLGPENILVWTLLSLIGALARAWAWVTIGRGLLQVSTPSPSPNIAGFANLVAGALGGVAVLHLLVYLVGPQPELWDGGSNGLYLLTGTFFLIDAMALAYLARIVVRGFGDPRRPAQATRLAATAFGVLGVVALLDATLGLATLFRTTFGLGFIPAFGGVDSGPVVGYVSFLGGWFFSGLMTSAFLASFALGLADASDGSGQGAEADPDDGPSWPEPGDPSSWPQPEIRPSG